jgi:hypothetical protein
MKSSRRRPIQKAKTPKDLADQFREWQELRAKVSKGDLAAAQNQKAPIETKSKENGQSPRKPPAVAVRIDIFNGLRRDKLTASSGCRRSRSGVGIHSLLVSAAKANTASMAAVAKINGM